MTIFLAILKIIGIVLLVVLCILVGLVLIVLFVPVRYEATLVSKEKVTLKAAATWLLHIVRLRLEYRDVLSVKLSVFAFPLLRDKKNKEQEKKKSKKQKSGKEESKEAVKEAPVRKAKRIFTSILDKLKHMNAMQSDARNKAALSHLKEEVVLLLKRICPKCLRVDMSYSTGSPDTTAQVFGILAMFPAGYRNRWKINPDFEAEAFYARGTAYLKGTIFLYQILFAFLRLFFDKNIRRFIKKIKN